MKCFVALASLSMAAAANTGSYASFSHHGQSYGYNMDGHPHEHAEPLYYQPKPTPAPYKPEPAPYKPAPASYKPAPAPYKPAPYQPAPYKPEPAYKPAPYHAEPAYKPAPYHPEPAYKPAPAYGAYEQPKHNCSVADVTRNADVCTPTFKQTCEQIELPIKRIISGEYCYDVARTVCTESIKTVDNEVCNYAYQTKEEATTAKTVEVSFKVETDTMMVTVCQPGYGYGHHGYGHNYCKEVAQETSRNVPEVAPLDVDVTVSYPEPVKTCVNKPISLPQISCEIVTENKCVVQPEIEEATESVERCEIALGEPACEQVELTLPQQTCVELVYGYAEEVPEHYTQ